MFCRHLTNTPDVASNLIGIAVNKSQPITPEITLRRASSEVFNIFESQVKPPTTGHDTNRPIDKPANVKYEDKVRFPSTSKSSTSSIDVAASGLDEEPHFDDSSTNKIPDLTEQGNLISPSSEDDKLLNVGDDSVSTKSLNRNADVKSTKEVTAFGDSRKSSSHSAHGSTCVGAEHRLSDCNEPNLLNDSKSSSYLPELATKTPASYASEEGVTPSPLSRSISADSHITGKLIGPCCIKLMFFIGVILF